MIFARIGHGSCYYHWNEIFAGVPKPKTFEFLKKSSLWMSVVRELIDAEDTTDPEDSKNNSKVIQRPFEIEMIHIFLGLAIIFEFQ